jgi:lipid II:glycine glycyltransferase (peptidoglycan interpeptide bridge formation enzyme)
MGHAPLMQSWAYGEVQAEEGWRPERVELTGGLALVLVAGRGLARWAYVPRGPVPSAAPAVEQLIAWARAENLARLRLEPDAPEALAEELRGLGFQPAPPLQPPHSMIVPLGPDDEAMLAAFKPKHRYNIRLAERKGVVVEEAADAAELVRLGAQTAERQGFSAYSEAAYERRLRQLSWCRVYVARLEGAALAAIMVARFDGRAYYLFGGSSKEGQKLMPAYAVQWAAMRAAAADGCTEYDLWGVPPDDNPSHPWSGLWQFKSGFNGELITYAGAWDLVLNPAGAKILEAGEVAKRAARRVRGNIR